MTWRATSYGPWLAADNGNKHTYVMESDGLDPAMLEGPER